MKTLGFAQAIESAVRQKMEEDNSIIIIGEDVHTLRLNLHAQFGNDRVKSTPLSEGVKKFVGWYRGYYRV